MGKTSFTTRLDADVLDLARRLAIADRRSVTAVIEVAVLEYGKHRGLFLPQHQPDDDAPATGSDDPPQS